MAGFISVTSMLRPGICGREEGVEVAVWGFFGGAGDVDGRILREPGQWGQARGRGGDKWAAGGEKFRSPSRNLCPLLPSITSFLPLQSGLMSSA